MLFISYLPSRPNRLYSLVPSVRSTNYIENIISYENINGEKYDSIKTWPIYNYFGKKYDSINTCFKYICKNLDNIMTGIRRWHWAYKLW